MKVALLIVSHSEQLAAGVAELASQMASGATVRAVGGTDDGRLGTSLDKIQAALDELRGAEHPVVVLTDLGSATMTVEMALEFADDDQIILADAPLVEGAVVAAVAAGGGASLTDVADQARSAWHSPTAENNTADDAATDAAATPDSAESTTPPAPSDSSLSETITVTTPEGLHARPAAQVVEAVRALDAEVTINGCNAASTLSLMTIGVSAGEDIEVIASGPDANKAIEAIRHIVAPA